MKKIFALLPMIAAFALTGCGDNEKESEKGTNLEFTEEQAKEKVRQLAQTDGYEITIRYSSSDSEGSDLDELTIGQKEGFTWTAAENSRTLWKEEETQFTIYSYDEEQSKFVVDHTYTKEYLESLGITQLYSLDLYATFLYMGNVYDGLDGYHKVKDLTYVGRSATDYKLKETYGTAYVEAKVIIDKQTGLTLYWGWEGRDLEGESGSAAYEVTSFKTGAAVNVPAHD